MNPPRILLADYCPVVHEGLRGLLQANRPDWEICAVASNALEAVAQAVALAPDLVIMGYQLPGSDGLTAALEIGRRAPQIEVLLFTGVDSPFILQQLYHFAVRGCLLKTEPIEEIISALETIRRHHRFRSRTVTELCQKSEPGRARYKALTRRQTEVTLLLAEGYEAKEVADRLGVSPRTVETHRTRIFKKLRVRTTVELVRHAIHTASSK